MQQSINPADRPPFAKQFTLLCLSPFFSLFLPFSPFFSLFLTTFFLMEGCFLAGQAWAAKKFSM